MEINSSTKKYGVFFEKNFSFINKILLVPNTFCIIDRLVYELYFEDIFSTHKNVEFYKIEALEKMKTMDTVLDICDNISKLSSKRNTNLISIGGGIIQDISGFVANILYRGISWVFIPTTLLAACDSCIGGKTSLNFKTFKNLIGTFYPPDEIHICSAFFNTLLERDYLSGLGEVVKFNIMQGKKGLNMIDKEIDLLLQRETGVIDRYVETSLLYKKKFVEEDEFDKGSRIYLNFAHTFGHAIEVASDFNIPHGTAVACGIIMANYISNTRSLMSAELMNKITDLVSKILPPIDPDSIKFNNFIDIMRMDKKQEGFKISAILFFDDNMQLQIFRDIEEYEIQKAIYYLLRKISK